MNQSRSVPDRLLAAAADLFARDGFDAVSVRQITSRAKANLGAITYHFGSKEALYHAVIDRVGAHLADRFVAITAEKGTPLERISRIVTMVLTEPHLPAPSMILRELATDRPLPPPLVQMMQRNMGAMMALIREGQADGSIRPGDPALLAMSPDTQRKLVKHVVTTITRSLAS